MSFGKFSYNMYVMCLKCIQYRGMGVLYIIKKVVQEVRHKVSDIITLALKTFVFSEFVWQIKWVG